MMFLQVIILLAGFLFLVKGADWFVEGAASIAKKPVSYTHLDVYKRQVLLLWHLLFLGSWHLLIEKETRIR